MSTELLFRSDAYLRSTPARIVATLPEGGILLDQTVFYASSGGQPGDIGHLELDDGSRITVTGTVHPDGDKTRALHLAAEGQRLPPAGTHLRAEIDWDRRYRLMRMHTALHLLSVVFAFPVTGGAIGEEKGRLDFDMSELPADIQDTEDRLNDLIAGDHAVTSEWITDEQMQAKADLIKTMNVKPPMGQGRVRLVRIGDIDLQPCGGTHVARTSEIGPVKLGKIEKKGARNRRVNLLFA